MQIIYANFQDNDDFVELFSKYKDEIGDLFQDGNQILSNQDYRCLYKRLANIAEWSLRPALHPCPSAETFVERIMNNEIPRIPAGEKKYFYRCFGIYLREATMRYGADFTNEGGFWQSMETGIQADLLDAYVSRNPGTQRPRNGFWGNNGIREELTNEILRGKTLLEYVFSFFDNPEINMVERNGAYFMRHLIKVAVCPLNYNPLRNDYENLLTNNQSIEAQLNMAERHTLDYHPDMRRQLVARIKYYFQGLPHIRHGFNNVDIDEYISNVLRQYFHIENPNHYFSAWLHRDLTNAIARPAAQIGWRIIPNEMRNGGTLNENHLMTVSYNVRSGSVIVKAPSDLDLDVVFGADLHLDPFGFYDILGRNNEILLRIEERQVQKPDGRDAYNVCAFKIFELDFINIRDEDGCIHSVKNPWVLKNDPCFIFDNNGRSVEKNFDAGRNHSYVIVLPEGEEITSIRYRVGGCENAAQMPVLRNQNGLAVYDWISDFANVDGVVIEVKCADGHYRQLNYEVNDSRYLHIYEDKDLLERTRFMYQQRGKKVGIGTLYLTHLSNDVHPQVVADQINRQVGIEVASVDEPIGRSHATRLKLSNGGHSVLYIPELEDAGGKVVPSIILLPTDAYFWMARLEGNRFCAYLKSEQEIDNLSYCWERQDDGKYIYHVDDYETWEHRGFPISFADNTPCVFSRKPYFKRLLNLEERMYFASEFFWSNNLFDDLIPRDALLYFKWSEYNHIFEAKIPSIHPVNKCLECFELVGCYPDMTFGWIYEGTEFLVKLFSDQNANPLPQRNTNVYEMTDEDRSVWLQNRVERDTINLRNLLNTFNQAFFEQDYEIEGLADFDNIHNREDALRVVGLRYLTSIEDVRRDLGQLSDSEKLEWLRKWLTVSDWEEMLKYLLSQLTLREDDWQPQTNDLCAAKKFNSAEDIDRFVATRFITRTAAQQVDLLIREYGLEAYRYSLPLDLLLQNNTIEFLQNENVFKVCFVQMVESFKKSRYLTAWNGICETRCESLVGYDHFIGNIIASRIPSIEQRARKFALWCITLYNEIACVSWDEMDLFIPGFLPSTLINFPDGDILQLAKRYAAAVRDCRAFAVNLGYEISSEEIANILAYTDRMLTDFQAETNHQLDFNQQKQGVLRLGIEKNRHLQNTERLRAEVKEAMTAAGKGDQLAQILDQMYFDYVRAGNPVTIGDFLLHILDTTLIFAHENQIWSNTMLGLRFTRENRPKIPAECLLLNPRDYRMYAMEHNFRPM